MHDSDHKHHAATPCSPCLHQILLEKPVQCFSAQMLPMPEADSSYRNFQTQEAMFAVV
jgi:hypothetical protein